jgi:hypothetical protein
VIFATVSNNLKNLKIRKLAKTTLLKISTFSLPIHPRTLK